eukprot:6201170-Pleurochrysis_carterae.AAC.1
MKNNFSRRIPALMNLLISALQGLDGGLSAKSRGPLLVFCGGQVSRFVAATIYTYGPTPKTVRQTYGSVRVVFGGDFSLSHPAAASKARAPVCARLSTSEAPMPNFHDY